MDVNNFLYYQVREGVEPNSVKDGLVRNAHRLLHFRKNASAKKTRYPYPSKIKSMRSQVRGCKNYKGHTSPPQVNIWNVPIYMRDYQILR